jgi:microcystin degradation protein MlrC
MRIVIGGMAHESNTLNPIITGEDDFVAAQGEELLEPGCFPGSSMRGIVDTLKKEGCELAPILYARAVPNGVVQADFYRRKKEDFVRRLREARAAGPIDGVCLALHGSMKVQGLGCAEGDLVRAIREVLPEVPVTAALDMHATITPELFEGVDGFAGYKTAPHVDSAETGALAAGLLLETLRTGKGLYTAWRKVPVLIAGEKSESEAEPMRSLLEDCRRIERRPRIGAASLLLGFPWADNEHNGVSILVTTLGDGPEEKKTAEEAAAELARAFWERRRDFAFRSEYYDSARSIETAFRAVLEEKQRPVFVSDSGDNPTAGAAGDATELLEELLKRIDAVDRLPRPLLYSGFYDAPAAAACVKAGTGAVVDTTLGGNWDRMNGKKIPLRLSVRNIVPNYGPYRADLILAEYRNILFTITSKHIGFGDPGLLPALGVRPEDHRLVVVKLGYLEPCFRDIARRAILALSRGCSNEALETIPYQKVPRPLYPLDPDMEWAP